MELIPEYAENIVVAVIYNGNFSWYVTDKEIWYMDYERRINDFREKGFKITLDMVDDVRRELLMLDINNVQEFEKKLIDFKATTVELREFINIAKEENEEWKYDYSPSLYLDFDNEILYSAYRESANYEGYIPNSWHSAHKEFLEDIPYQFRYWINQDGENYFE